MTIFQNLTYMNTSCNFHVLINKCQMPSEMTSKNPLRSLGVSIMSY